DHRVWDAPVDDVGGLHAAVDGIQAGGHLRDHAAIQGREELLQLFRGQAGDQRVLVWPVRVEARHVSEHNESLSVQCSRQRTGGGVGIDVVDQAFVIRGDRRDHRNATGIDEVEETGGVNVGDAADPADVHQVPIDL